MAHPPSTDRTGAVDRATLARRALARPGTARLLVDGLSGQGPAEEACEGVELADRDGTPLLACDPGSALELAAEQRRTATLTVLGRSSRRSVLMRGRLACTGHQRLGGRDVALIELVLDGVRLAGGGGEPPADIDLPTYHAATTSTLEDYAAVVLEHTNDDHAGDLLGFVADLTGCPAASIAAARLAALDPTGIVVRWVDLDGAHEVRVLFTRRARCREDLAELLRSTLCPTGPS